MPKILYQVLFAFLLCTGIVRASSFEGFYATVTDVMAYAGDTNYTYDTLCRVF